MLNSMRSFLSPPKFPADQEKTRLASWLHTIILVLIAVRILLIVRQTISTNFVQGLTDLYNLPALIFLVIAMVLLRMGYLRWSAGILLASLLIITSITFLGIGGLASPYLSSFIFMLAIAALVIGEQGVIAFTILVSIIFIGMGIAESRGLVTVPPPTSANELLFGHILISLLTGFILWLTTRSLGQSLKRAREKETELRLLAEGLEARIEERSRTLTEALRIARLGNWEYDFIKDEFTFNDDFYAMMRTTAEREGGYTMNAAQYAGRFVYPEDAPIVGVEIGKSVETTDPNFSTEVDHRVIFGDGEVGYVTVRFRIEKDAQGRTVKSFGANQDITVQKRAEVALISSETQLAETSRLARMASWEYDFIKDEFTFSDDFYTLMRTTAEQEGGYKMASAQYADRFVHPEDIAVVGAEIGKSVETTDPNYHTEVEHRVIFGNGEPGHVIVRFRVEKNAQGRTVKSYGANQDITERKRAEENLTQNEALLRTIIDSTPDWIFIKNAQHRYVLVNQAYADDIHMSPDDLIGKNDIEVGFPEDIVKGNSEKGIRGFWPDDREVMELGQVKIIDEEPAVIDGENVVLKTIKVPLKNPSGEVWGVLGFVHDITESKKATLTLAKRATELETVTQVATSTATIQNPQEMLQYVSDLTKERFDFYHAHIYLLDEQDGMLELTAGAGEAGRTMVAAQHAIPLTREQSLVARAARTHQGVLVNDVTQAPDFLPNPLLPDTRSELAVPLVVRDRVLGVLDIQSAQVNAFTEEDIRIQTILAAQIAVALENARANERSAKTLQELDTLTRRLTREGWQTYLSQTENQHIRYAFEENRLIDLKENGFEETMSPDKVVILPIELRGEKVGRLIATDVEMEKEDLNTILQAVSQGLSAHLENLRLTEEAERRVNELGVVNEIGQTLASEVDLQRIIETVINNLNQAFNANIAYIALYDQENQLIEIPYMLHHGEVIREEPSFSYGEGINSEIIKTRQAIFINQDTERRLLELGALPTSNNTISKSFMGVPMITGDRVIGVLSVQDADREGRFSIGDLNLLKTISSNVAVAIQNARLYADARKRAEREMMVNLIGQKIQSATTVQGALQTAIQELGVALKARQTLVELGSGFDEKQKITVAGD